MNSTEVKKIEDLDGEIWKPVIGFEGLYEVSNRARVKSLIDRWRGGHEKHNERLMKLNSVGRGYYGLQLKKNGVYTRYTIHRLVGIHFIPNPENLPQINHKKGIKSLNWDTDLEWGTAKHNINHAFDTGLNKKVQKNSIHISKPIVQLSLDGTPLRYFPSASEAQRQLGFKTSNISNVLTGKKALAYGYKWKYQ